MPSAAPCHPPRQTSPTASLQPNAQPQRRRVEWRAGPLCYSTRHGGGGGGGERPPALPTGQRDGKCGRGTASGLTGVPTPWHRRNPALTDWVVQVRMHHSHCSKCGLSSDTVALITSESSANRVGGAGPQPKPSAAGPDSFRPPLPARFRV